MKTRIVTLFLLAVMTVSMFTGCSLWTLEERLDTVEESVENRVDAAQDAVEGAIIDAITPSVSEAPVQTEIAVQVPDSSVQEISKEEAEAIALAHANLTAADVKFLRTEYGIDDGVPEYEVQFHHDYWEYDYDIHAETGAIRSFDKDD